jgi:mannose-6-phosphate isomerase-like protein (cupin superfamily)
MKKRRRVITGTVEGKTAITSDEVMEPITVALAPGMEFFPVWGADEPQRLPHDGKPPKVTSWFPGPSGFRFTYLVLPHKGAETPTDVDVEAAMREAQEKLPGLFEHFDDPDAPGMHQSNTIDWIVVLSGKLSLELDNGQEVELNPGDCVVQNGTRHAWHNRGSEPTVMLGAIFGAESS